MTVSGCDDDCRLAETGRRHRRILWMVLGLNVETFLVEIVAGVIVGSVSVCADALDFFGDLVTT
jgi:Co/Zn/Cd efflux system component